MGGLHAVASWQDSISGLGSFLGKEPQSHPFTKLLYALLSYTIFLFAPQSYPCVPEFLTLSIHLLRDLPGLVFSHQLVHSHSTPSNSQSFISCDHTVSLCFYLCFHLLIYEHQLANFFIPYSINSYFKHRSKIIGLPICIDLIFDRSFFLPSYIRIRISRLWCNTL